LRKTKKLKTGNDGLNWRSEFIRRLTLADATGSGFVPRINQHARQMQTVIGLVATGMGFALVPESVKNLKRAGVQYRALRGSTASIALGILRAQDDDNPLGNHFVAVLKGLAAGGSV
jgi:DNA-binding transcriptional LysR family regulator